MRILNEENSGLDEAGLRKEARKKVYQELDENPDADFIFVLLAPHKEHLDQHGVLNVTTEQVPDWLQALGKISSVLFEMNPKAALSYLNGTLQGFFGEAPDHFF